MNRQLSFGKNKNSTPGNKPWVHPADALTRGHIVYNVKFLGHVEVDQPKGIEVVKDAIRKMKFNKQIKRAEGQKPPKVELTISVDGVTIQEPKLKVIQHQYPLHRISYCADDKSDKRMFTFIAKEGNTTVHRCFVFDSDKCAEEITLTIGQAFDLAYKKFMETSGRDMDAKKQFLLLQKKVQQLTAENLQLKARVADLERLIDPQVLEQFEQSQARTQNGKQMQPTVGRRLENLMLDDEQNAPQTNGSARTTSPTNNTAIPALAPPPPVPPRQNMPASNQVTSPSQPQAPGKPVDLFGSTPFTAAQSPPPGGNAPNPFASPSAQDPFGMAAFNPNTPEFEKQLQRVDNEFLDLQAGFSQGLSFGTEDFNLDDLDPLKK